MENIIFYRDIYEVDIKLMNMIVKEYGENEKAWKLFYKLYEDPDGYPVGKEGYKTVDSIKCTVDGLLSVKRIKEHERGFGKDFVNVFQEYRKSPIIFFPCEKYGINWSRGRVFGDRIDHTLFDLKQKCEGTSDCRLELAYNLPKTSKWLKHFNYDFAKIVDWLKINDIFVNAQYEVYDLEYDKDEKTISKYYDDSLYHNRWSEQYYENLKKKIREFDAKNNVNNSDN